MDDNEDSEMKAEDNTAVGTGTDLEIEGSNVSAMESNNYELEEGEIVDSDSDVEIIDVLPLPTNRKRKCCTEFAGSYKECRTNSKQHVEPTDVRLVEKPKVCRKQPMPRNTYEELDSLYSDVKVEVVVDPNRPQSIQSDDSYSESELYQSNFLPINNDDLEFTFSCSVTVNKREESPIAGPSHLPPIESNVDTSTNPRKRAISSATSADKRSRTCISSLSSITSVRTSPAQIPQKSYGYFVPSSQPSYQELLNFYRRSVAVASVNPFHRANGYFVPSTQPSYTELLQFYKQSLAATAANASHVYNNSSPVVFSPDSSIIQYNKLLGKAYSRSETELSKNGSDCQE